MELDRNAMLKQFSEPDEKLLFSKAMNQAYLCMKNNIPCFTDFFDPLRFSRFSGALAGFKKHLDVEGFGGFPDAERRMLGFFPKEGFDETVFPIGAVVISFEKKFGSPAHRDILGSVLGLGLDRRVLGDVLPCDGFFIAYAETQMAVYIAANLEKAGRISVRCEQKEITGIPKVQEKKLEKSITVASMRLDGIIAESFNLSRNEASELIKKEKVFLNWVVASSNAKTVNCSDIVTVRHLGRVKILDISGQTKKGRMALKIELYK